MAVDYDPDPHWRRSSRPHPFEVFPEPARRDVFSNNLPSAPRDHAPAIEDFPRGWTCQQPWYHSAYPVPADNRCVLCAQVHGKDDCLVTEALVALVGTTSS